MKQVMHLQFQEMKVGGVQMKAQGNGEEMHRDALNEVPRHTPGRGNRFSESSYERWLTFENLSLQRKLNFGDPFQDSGERAVRPARNDHSNLAGIPACIE